VLLVVEIFCCCAGWKLHCNTYRIETRWFSSLESPNTGFYNLMPGCLPQNCFFSLLLPKGQMVDRNGLGFGLSRRTASFER